MAAAQFAQVMPVTGKITCFGSVMVPSISLPDN
jgi:hypothetical protein